MDIIEIVEKLQNHDKTIKESQIKRWENIRWELAEKNNDIYPTEDPKGRLHAPFDGYSCFDGVYEKEFLAGQYLPFEKERDWVTKEHPEYTKKIRVPVSFADEIEKNLTDICKTSIKYRGKIFLINDIQFQNIWLCGSNFIKTLILEEAERRENNIKKEYEEEHPVGTPFIGEGLEVTGIITNMRYTEGWYGNDQLKCEIKYDNNTFSWGNYSMRKFNYDIPLEDYIGKKITIKANFTACSNKSSYHNKMKILELC